MIVGIGTDIVRIDRLRRSIGRSGEGFLGHVYTDRELARAPAHEQARNAYLAGRWAAKEAVAKALGTGIAAECSLRDIDVANDLRGAPVLALQGAAADTARRLGIRAWHLSISHEQEYACATAVAEGDTPAPAAPPEDGADAAAGAAPGIPLGLPGRLLARGWLLGTAESCTGGGIGALCTAVPGSSEWFAGGFITYSDECKRRMLGVSQETLERHGAVSEETVREMLRGIRERGGMQAGVAVSGIAGPGGAVPGKPVGTVFIGAAVPGRLEVRRRHFDGDRAQVRRQTAADALRLLDSLL